MEIIIKGDPEEIAVLVLAVQGRHPEEAGAEFARELHQAIKDRQEALRSS